MTQFNLVKMYNAVQITSPFKQHLMLLLVKISNKILFNQT